jgi:predicted TIM-barrel fold metal-dependent hydrolase
MDMVLADMWDTHVHCFDPKLYPFKTARAYTPGPAPLEALVRDTQTSKIVLVQASIEDGYRSLIAHLQRIQTEHPHILARGIVCMDENWESLTDEDFDFLEVAGVRSCRIHGFHGGGETSISSVEKQVRQFARSYPARKFGWSLSAQLPLKLWVSLSKLILSDPEVSCLTIIADHNGCATPADIGGAELDVFIEMLRSGRFYIKVSALYRRSPDCIHCMRPIIQRFADSAPRALLWGSDWPHVDSSHRSLHPPTGIAIQTKANVPEELLALGSWLTEKQWSAMLIENPQRLFGNRS